MSVLNKIQKIVSNQETFLAQQGFKQAKRNSQNSTEWLRKGFEYSIFKSYLDNINKELEEDYIEFITNYEESLENTRDSQRIIKESQKKKLTDKCALCNHKKSEIHHIIPYSQGGSTKVDNLIVLCKFCHKTVEEYQAKLALVFTKNGPESLKQLKQLVKHNQTKEEVSE